MIYFFQVTLQGDENQQRQFKTWLERAIRDKHWISYGRATEAGGDARDYPRLVEIRCSGMNRE